MREIPQHLHLLPHTTQHGLYIAIAPNTQMKTSSSWITLSLSLSPPSWNFTHYHELLRLQYRDPKTQDFGRHSRFGWDPFGHRSRIHHLHCIWRSGSFSFLCFSCASERATRSVFTEFLAKYGKTLNKEREEKREIGKTLKDSSTATVEDYDLPLTPDQFIEEIIPMYQQK